MTTPDLEAPSTEQSGNAHCTRREGCKRCPSAHVPCPCRERYAKRRKQEDSSCRNALQLCTTHRSGSNPDAEQAQLNTSGSVQENRCEQENHPAVRKSETLSLE